MAVILPALQQSLSAEFDIPTDVKFLFKRKEVDGSTKTEEIRAHKHILALASDVFKRGFYGGMEDQSSIVITDVTKEVFEIMINRVYDKETNMRDYDFDMLCSIYYLSDKYNITALEEETLDAIKSKKIQLKDTIQVGVLAIQQHAVHGKLAATLLEASAQKLARTFNEFNGDLNKALEYLSKVNGDNSLDLDLIKYRSVMKIVAKMRNITACSNCKVFPCITGVKLSKDNFVPGAKIMPIPNHSTAINLGIKLRDGRFLGLSFNEDVFLEDSLKKFVFNC